MAAERPIRVGFGPITTSNSFHQSGLKVARLMGENPRFVCGFFQWEPFRLEELLKFDVLVFIKYYPDYDLLSALRQQGRRLILDYQDMFLYPSVYELNLVKKLFKKIYYFRHESSVRRKLRMMDLCFVASPVLADIVRESGMHPYFLQRQPYNDGNEKHHKKYDLEPDQLVVYWTGVGLNQPQNRPILPVLKRLHDRHNCRIVYSTDTQGNEPFIEYRRWNRDSWEAELVEADIAFRWRDTSNLQRCKDANKVMAYMGAALPVVIYPTEAEKLIVEDGVTGFLAYHANEFEEKMIRLVNDQKLRKRVGLAAHKDVWSKYSLSAHVEEIKNVIISLVRVTA